MKMTEEGRNVNEVLEQGQGLTRESSRIRTEHVAEKRIGVIVAELGE